MTSERRRRSIRLRDYDYRSSGAYFVTICAYQRRPEFRDPGLATIVRETWFELPGHFADVFLDDFVVMPNHIHAIIVIADPVGAQHAAPLRRFGVQPRSLGAIVRSLKSATTRRFRQHSRAVGRLWQRNYYERVIRSEAKLNRVREYIQSNPSQWLFDHENPQRIANRTYDREWSWLEAT